MATIFFFKKMQMDWLTDSCWGISERHHQQCRRQWAHEKKRGVRVMHGWRLAYQVLSSLEVEIGLAPCLHVLHPWLRQKELCTMARVSRLGTLFLFYHFCGFCVGRKIQPVSVLNHGFRQQEVGIVLVEWRLLVHLTKVPGDNVVDQGLVARSPCPSRRRCRSVLAHPTPIDWRRDRRRPTSLVTRAGSLALLRNQSK